MFVNIKNGLKQLSEDEIGSYENLTYHWFCYSFIAWNVEKL